MGKHIDIIPEGYIPGEDLWTEHKQLSSDFELHNIRNNTHHPNTISMKDDIKEINEKEHHAAPRAAHGHDESITANK